MNIFRKSIIIRSRNLTVIVFIFPDSNKIDNKFGYVPLLPTVILQNLFASKTIEFRSRSTSTVVFSKRFYRISFKISRWLPDAILVTGTLLCLVSTFKEKNPPGSSLELAGCRAVFINNLVQAIEAMTNRISENFACFLFAVKTPKYLSKI